MQQGDSMVGDNSCYFEEKVQSHVPCNGVCVTANVTNETGHVVGESNFKFIFVSFYVLLMKKMSVVALGRFLIRSETLYRLPIGLIP